MQNIEEIKWTNGIPAERSRKEDKPGSDLVNLPDEAVNIALGFNNEAYFNKNHSMEQELGEFRQTNSKREVTSQKMGEREMIKRVSNNPFSPADTYLKDLDMQDKMLRPKNSNYVEMS